MSRYYGVMKDYDYSATHKRERLTVWSGAFASQYEAVAYSLPKGDGYMLRLWDKRIRVECPTPRDDTTYEEIDRAINAALNDYYKES